MAASSAEDFMSIEIAATEMEEDPGHFDGASGAARADPEKHHEC